VGRADLRAAIERQLAAGGSVVLTGPSGIGKTAVMDAVGAAVAARGERVLRVGAPKPSAGSPTPVSPTLQPGAA
jgi:ABC-type lipoprotein export system ATPase subunit